MRTPRSKQRPTDERRGARRTVGPIVALAVATTTATFTSAVIGQESPPTPIVEDSGEPMVRFNFKGQSWDQVLDYFSRASGLPIVRAVDVPSGTVDYIHPTPYPLSKALETLNILLQTRQVMLRRDDGRLVLDALDESKRVNVPTFVGELPSEVTPDTVVTLIVPLLNATAVTVAEQLKTMVGEYGMLVALPEQNSILVVETAANVRRLRMIVDELDREDKENAIEQIPLQNASAEALLPVLQKLMSERVVKTVTRNKKPVQVEEDVMPAGFRITSDARTNTIIARGTPKRIERLRAAIQMLDTPKVGSVRQMRTIQLERLTVDGARAKLDQLFAGLPEDKRPTYVVLADTNRLTISADPGVIDQATQFLADLESGGSLGPAAGAETVALLPLEFASPESATTAVRAVLNPRQLSVVKIVPGPDGRSLVVAGPAGDLDAVRRTLVLVDRPATIDRQVRYLTVEAVDPVLAVERATRMYETESASDPTAAVTVDFQSADRSLVLEGTPAALDAFERTLRAASATIEPVSSVRQFTIANTDPSRIVPSLQSLSRSMLKPRDGGPFVAPVFEAVDPLGLLVVEAPLEQYPVIEELVSTLDRAQPRDIAFRVVPVGDLDGESLLARTFEAFDRQAALLPENAMARPKAIHDPATGSLEILGQADAVAAFERSLVEVRRRMPAPAAARLIEVRQVKAGDIVDDLRDMVATTVDLGSRPIPAPIIEVVEPTNSLWVKGEAAQLAAIADLVKRLDVFEPTEMPPLRMLQLAGSDANQIAALLTARYDARPTDVRREEPVRIEADAATNTLVVTAAEPVFEEIRSFVDSLNRNSDSESERETMIFPLRLARAVDLSKALGTLYPEPPMPTDSRGRPLPHLRQPREVFVSADAGTNTLIIEAPSARRASFEQLVQQLDRIELPPQAELRTWDVSRGEGDQIARTLSNLARQGVLSKPGANGEKSVEVTVEFEPRSRTLIVAGDDFTFSKVTEILEDLQAVPVARSLQVIEITAGDAAAISDRASRLYTEQTEGDPEFGEVDVEVDVVNGTILAVGEEASLARFTQVVRQLESAQSRPPDVRLLTLEHTDAAEVAAMLEQLLGNELSAAVLGGSPPAIEPLVAVNALLVAAQPREHEIIGSVVDTLDVPEDEVLPPIRILQLRTADASNLAEALMATYDRRTPEERRDRPVRISADLATNALVVAAHPEMLEEIRAITAELNDADRVDAEGREIRIFPLRVARAEDLAQTIDQMYPEPPMPLDFRGRPRPDLREPREVVVRANPQMNALIVDAPIQRMAGFEKLVQQLDQAQIVAESEIRTWKLPAIELESAARAIEELASAGHLGATDAGTTISVSVDAASDTLIVSGPPVIFDRVGAVIDSLGQGPLTPTTSLRTFRLLQARAESLAPMLREVLVARIREDLPGDVGQVDRLLTVTADRKTNTLIVSAPDVVMPIAEQLVQTLDATGSAIGDPTVRVRPLSFADAAIVATALQQAIPSMTSTATGDSVEVKVVPATGSNALLLVGIPQDIEEVETLIEPLDARPATDAVDARTFELVHADASRVAPIVQKLLDDQQDSDPRIMIERIRRSRGMVDLTPKVRVEADDRTNSLIVSGPQQTVNLAEGLIAKLDRPDVDAERRYSSFTPRNLDPQKVVESAARVLEDTRPSGTRSTLELVVEPQSGTIMVIGSAEETVRATDLLRSWDDSVPELPAVDLRVVDLATADAAAVAPSISAVLRDRSRWPQSLRAALRAGLPVAEPSVTADVATNRLLISAPAELQSVATALLAQLDRTAEDAAVEVRVYPVPTGDADGLASALSTALSAAARPGESKPVVAAASRAEAVIVTASPRLQQVVADQLEQVLAGGGGTQVRTLFLDHASAARIAPLIEGMLAGGGEVDLDGYPRWMRAELVFQQSMSGGGEVKVMADERLNAVVATGPVAALNVAEQLARQLDVAPAGGDDRRIRVLEVRNADAAVLGTTLDELFAATDDGSTPPLIRVNAESNTLLVRADARQFQQIEEIVRDIDDASVNVARELRTVPIDPGRSSAEDVARVLERMLERDGEDRVRIVPLDELLERRKKKDDPGRKISADRPARGGMRALVAGLALAAVPVDVPAADPRPAVSLVDVQEAAAEPRPETLPEPGPATAAAQASDEDADGGDVVIAIDPATNSLVVLGPPRELDRLAELADTVEDNLPEEGGVIRTVPLPTSIDAGELANVVNQTLRMVIPAGGVRGDLFRRAMVVADPVSNALVVTCREDDFEIVADLIASTARPPEAPEVVVRLYPLQQTSVDRASSGLRTLLARPRGSRFEELSLAIDTDGVRTEATFDPALVTVIPDGSTNTLIVVAPPAAIDFVDRFVSLTEQAPPADRTTLRLFELRYARAADLRRTLSEVFDTRFRNQRRAGGGTNEPEFAFDERSNQLIVTASTEELAEVERLIAKLDVEDGREQHPLTVLELAAATPSSASGVLDRAVIGSDERLRATTLILADDPSGVLLVRADEDTLGEIRDVLDRIDREATSRFPVRTIELARADAGRVSESISRFYTDRARLFSTGRGRRTQSASVAITGTPGGGTLLVACDDETFAEVEQLARTFDQTDATEDYDYRIYELKHARAEELSQTIEELVGELVFTSGLFGQLGSRRNATPTRDTRGSIAVRAEERINALVVSGRGDNFKLVEELIQSLDIPTPADERRVVRHYRVAGIESDLLEEVLREAIDADSGRGRWWDSGGDSGATVLTDRGADFVVVVGTEQQQADVQAIVADLDASSMGGDTEVVLVRTEFADSDDVAGAVSRFLADRSRATGIDETVVITPVRGANAILVAGPEAEVRTVEDLVGRIDAPDTSGNRSIEIIRVERGQAAEIARLVGAQFERRGGDGVVITPDARTNSILVNAPTALVPEIQGLVARLDAPDDTDQSVIRTYRLTTADADAAVSILEETLRLDEDGRTTGISITPVDGEEPVEVRATIVADRRSNSLVVTATPESLPVIEAIVEELEAAPARSPVEYRIVQLEHAPAADVSITIDRLLMARGDDWRDVAIDYNRFENQLVVGATPDQFEVIGDILAEIDVPAVRTRKTDFVGLEFADAAQVADALGNFYGPYAFEADTPGKQNVKIIADEATNSLVITAAEAEWTGILALVGKLDAEEYDSSMQLEVLPLMHADARSVARAINEAFRPVLEQARREQQGNNNRRGAREEGERERGEGGGPTVLMTGEDWVSASAEPQTNALIISASRRNLNKIERIVEQIDVAEFANLAAPRIIPVESGDPEALADALRSMYLPDGERSPTLRIVGDRASNSVIVRADDQEFMQILALATALQQEADDQGLSVRVVRLESAPATRVAESIRGAFAAKASQDRLPFSIQVDPVGNALVVASTGPLFEEVERTVREMDRLSPASGQGIFIIDLENVPADVAERTVRRIGLDRPATDASSRLVVEPIKLSRVEGRNALLVVANPADRETVVGLLKAIDAEPEVADAEVRVVPLENARASAVMGLIDQVIDPAGGGPDGNRIATAVKEQIRRLAIRGIDGEPIALDIAVPIRVTADDEGNALIISSNLANVTALEQVARLFDRLPTTESLTVQLFPLDNIAAERFVDIVEQVFEQGRDLATLTGLDVPAMPEGALGPALLEEVALAVDERTNTVIAAGKESAVAFVEVMQNRLDSEVVTGWVEPRVIRLEFADAADLADLIDEVVVQGQSELPGATPLQRQVARLRSLRDGARRAVDSEVFVPLSRLLVRADEQLNALVVVASPPNLALVEDLVAMLDVEAAAPGALVRIYAVENGSAERIASLAKEIFEAQAAARGGVRRDEDRLEAIPDLRTNSIVVSTSLRNFQLFESLLERLDTPLAAEFREVRILPLQHAAASRLAPLVQRLVDARLERLRRVQPETADLEKAVVLSDDLANALVIAAGEETFQVIESLVLDLDQDQIGMAADVRVVPVTRGGLERIAQAIEQVMDRRYAGVPNDVARRDRPLVIPDPRSSSLLVAANPEDRRSIEDLVERLEDTPLNPAVEIEVLALDSGSARDIAPRIEALMRERTQSLGEAGQPSDRVSIEPLDGSNAIVVAASRENQVVVRDLVDLLVAAEQDRIGDQSFEIVTVANNRASELVDLVEELYADAENRRRGPDSVRVSADDRLNALLVSGTPGDVGAVRDLVSRLDSERPGSVVEVRSIPLASANAQEMVGLIETVLNGGGGRRGRGGQVGTILRYLQEMDGEEPEGMEVEVSTAIRESIGLTPDVRTNTIIVTAPSDSMTLIERMIRDLDASDTGSKKIEVFKLVNADADAMADILTDLFQLRQQGSLYVLKPREGGVAEVPGGVGEAPLPGGGEEMFGTDLTLVPDERQALSITVDSRTNSLIVSGTPRYLELVANVVNELDAQDANERETLVYNLRNAQADEVARVVSEFVSEDQRKLVETLSSDQLPSAARLLEREVTIVGDAKSNAVLVNASPRYIRQVESIIEELDVDPPQVLIQVMLAEITLDDNSDFGVTLNDKVGTIPFASRVQFSSPDFFSQPITGSFSVGFSDLSLVLSAMYDQGRVQILSNPSITVANNEQGRIQVGQEVRLPDAVLTSEFGSQSSSVVAQDLGVILEVLPSINPDGFVRMQVQPTLSRLSDRTTEISETFRSPIIDKREAQTTVTVKDGETVVLGGLIEEYSERRDMKVPVLGDIPLIGGLFRSETETRRRTELLIVLTPHVVGSNTETGLIERTRQAIDELPLSEELREQFRKGQLDGNPDARYDSFEEVSEPSADPEVN